MPLESCILWKDPEATVKKGLPAQFALIKTFVKQSHWWRYLLECRDCGQSYVFEFYEEVDWEGGKDPQFTTWVPVASDEEIAAVQAAPPSQLSSFVPRLCKDWPKDQEQPVLYWVKDEKTD